MRLLLVEDHPELAALVIQSLGQSGFMLDHAPDGETALLMMATSSYDLILLDLSLGRIDGLQVLKSARSRNLTTPILILTARSEISDRILGLDLGADDYIAKPFDLGELEARIKAQLRRRQGGQPTTSFGELTFDSVERQFYCNGSPLVLARRELAVLEALFLRAGRVATRDVLFQRVFSMDDEVSPEAIELYVSRVRKKLKGSSLVITAVRGVGYLLEQRTGS
ncbi:response regulator [Cupriavidus sp. H19C3]|uniref:response regulator n=1 Tax=Cupriavidus sp. H19C3 TaxID=3241603 RepID=UPI003BF89ED5